jgi:hypothetical protein
MKFFQVTTTLLAVAATSSTFCLAAPIPNTQDATQAAVVVNPHITAPQENDFWAKGSKHVVRWGRCCVRPFPCPRPFYLGTLNFDHGEQTLTLAVLETDKIPQGEHAPALKGLVVLGWSTAGSEDEHLDLGA